MAAMMELKGACTWRENGKIL